MRYLLKKINKNIHNLCFVVITMGKLHDSIVLCNGYNGQITRFNSTL